MQTTKSQSGEFNNEREIDSNHHRTLVNCSE